MECFSCETKIFSGSGAVNQLSRLEIQRLLVVTDPYFMKNGTAHKIGQCANATATEYFDKVSPDPDVTLAAQGAGLVRSWK